MAIDLTRYIKGSNLSFNSEINQEHPRPYSSIDSYFDRWSHDRHREEPRAPVQTSHTTGAVRLRELSKTTTPEIVLKKSGNGTYDIYLLPEDHPQQPFTQERYGLCNLMSADLGDFVEDIIREEQPEVIRAVKAGETIFVVYREGPKTRPHDVDPKTKEKLLRLEQRRSDPDSHRPRRNPWMGSH